MQSQTFPILGRGANGELRVQMQCETYKRMIATEGTLVVAECRLYRRAREERARDRTASVQRRLANPRVDSVLPERRRRGNPHNAVRPVCISPGFRDDEVSGRW